MINGDYLIRADLQTTGPRMNRDAVLAGLEDAGLSEYEAEAYLTLLERGTSKAVDVARRSSIPVPRIYDVVKELEQRGYVETLDRDTLHVRAHEPVHVIEDLHDRSQRLSNVAGAIEDRWEQTPVAEHDVTVTKRAETAIDHARELIRDADTSVDLAVSSEEFGMFEESLATLATSNVLVRLSLHLGDEGTEAPDSDVLNDAVTEVRERAYRSPLLAVVDGQTTCYAPTGSMPDPIGVIAKGQHLTLVFRWYFQTCLWSVWEPPDGRVTGRSRFVSLEEFICDVYEEWADGASIRVRVEGIDTRTGNERTVEGELIDVRYTGQAEADAPPTLTDLSGEAAIVVSDGDHSYTVGGWGARIEDLEARRIDVPERVVTR